MCIQRDPNINIYSAYSQKKSPVMWDFRFSQQCCRRYKYQGCDTM